jgi:hypothetical protein
MRRGVVTLAGLAVLAAGVWLVATEHGRAASCHATSGMVFGISNSCQSVGWVYFAGFAAACFGIILVGFSGLMRRHELRIRRHHDRPTEFSLRMGDGDSARRARR